MFNFYRLKKGAKLHQSNIEKYKQYLYLGKYRLYCRSGRYTWKKENSYLKWVYDTVFHSNIPFKQRLKIVIFSHPYIITKESPWSCGDELYVTRKSRLKIFDHSKKLVYYFPFDDGVIEKAECFRNKYAPYFGKQIINNIDSTKQCITERYVVEKTDWRKDAVYVIKNTQIVWAALCGYTKSSCNDVVIISVPEYVTTISNLCKDKELSVLVQEIGTSVVKHIKDIPTIPQHNDMVLSNILMEDDGISVFDYEFFDYNLFYYDAMMFIIWEAVHYNNDVYLHNYLNGDYDPYFSALFEALNCAYDRVHKRDYVELFLAVNIHMHLITGDKTNIPKYRRVLNMLRNRPKYNSLESE